VLECTRCGHLLWTTEVAANSGMQKRPEIEVGRLIVLRKRCRARRLLVPPRGSGTEEGKGCCGVYVGRRRLGVMMPVS
jgi:hypothetical protein